MGKHLPKDIKAMARAHTDSALRVLTGIMTNELSPPNARVTAALGVLDRGWGKAAQAIELSGEITNKVIRSPQVIDNISEWSNQYVPEQHRTEH